MSLPTNEMKENTPPIVTSQPTSNTSTPRSPNRKVSIASSVGDNHHYDNPAFEHDLNRKTSQDVPGLDRIHSLPMRKRSILTNGMHDSNVDSESIYSNYSHDIKKFSELNHKQPDAVPNKSNIIEESWIYTFCVKCRGEDSSPSWEPPMWSKFCPFPLCPTFRQFSRSWCIIAIGMIAWLVLYTIIGGTAAPGGRLFDLIVLIVAANFGGFLISLTNLPRLIGMLLTGILLQNAGIVNIVAELSGLTGYIRKFSLVLILIRAGLEMDPDAFKRVYTTILKLGLVPWTVECCLCAVLTNYFFDLPWLWAFALGAIIAAVSPAVIVACLFRLRTKGYGVAKGIPTLIIAISGIDDAASVAVFGILASLIFGTGGISYQISQAPVCIFGGIIFGVIWGTLMKFFPEKGDAYVIPIRMLMLFAGGLLAVIGSEELGYEGAGPLGVVFAAFVGNYFWCKDGWDVEDNPVGTAFQIFWMFFEPALFGVTGAAIKIDELDKSVVAIGLGILIVTGIVRILITALIAFGDNLNLKEKIFCSMACMSKATVQAALGPIILRRVNLRPHTDEEVRMAQIVLTVCILSIVLTAPVGAILISISGPRLLTKTKPLNPDGYRRSHRPSLYDISVMDENKMRRDPELQNDLQTIGNTNANAHNNFLTVPK